jgi:hypothetical protein
MKRLVAVAFATSLAAAPVGAESPPGAGTSGGSNPVDPGSYPAAPDDTGRNVRDRSGELPTPMDQSNTPSDLRITQTIRQAIVAEDGLSMNARNVKVITADGIVTLRGPVASEVERAKIESIARGLEEVRRVDSQLEVEESNVRP